MLGSNNDITVTRMAADANGHLSFSEAVLTTKECYMERMSLSEAALIDAGNPYEVYELIYDGTTELKVNDKVVDRNDREFRVVSTWPVDDFVKFQKAALKQVIQA